MSKLIDITGENFGRWTVIKHLGHSVWECKCTCGKIGKILGKTLKNGASKSCGCLSREESSKRLKKYNDYDLASNKFGIGLTSNTTKKFYFDLEDYDKIKNYCWYETSEKIVAHLKGKTCLQLHNLILPIANKKTEFVKHLNKNFLDNRKQNLEIASKSHINVLNKLRKDNKTGIKGVFLYRNGKYLVTIKKNNHSFYLGYYDTITEAERVRKKAEIELYGE